MIISKIFMMRAKTGKIIAVLFFGALAATAGVYTVSAAAETGNAAESGGFCADLPSIARTLNQRIADRQSDILAKQASQMSRLFERRNSRDNRLVEKRSQWEALRAKQFEKIRVRADSDNERQAVDDFRDEVESAVKAKNEAYDALRRDFRDKVDGAMQERKNRIKTAVESYKSAVKKALGKASADCRDGADGRSVRQALRSQLKSAREKFAGEKNEIQKINLEGLAAEKREAINKIRDDFRGDIERAKDYLKYVFGEI